MKNLLNDLEDLGFDTQIQFEEFQKYFRDNYGHVHSITVTDSQLTDFLKQDYIRRLPIEKKADYFNDYIMSQGLCDYVE